MRIVLDTNVLVSGVLNPHGPPGRILDHVLAGDLSVLVDDRILSEYREVLLRPRFQLESRDVHLLLEFLVHESEQVLARALNVELPDPDDLAFLEVATTGQADALVTGNERHFPVSVRGAVAVETPARFLRRIRES